MDRKAWISITLCLIGLFGWQWWYQKQYGESLSRQRAEAAAETAKASPTPAVDQPAPVEESKDLALAAPAEITEAAPDLAAPAAPIPANPVDPGKTYSTTAGAMELKFTTRGGGLADIGLMDHEGESGGRIHLNLNTDIPIGSIGSRPEDLGRDQYEFVKQNADEVVFEGNPSPALKVRKRFVLPVEKTGVKSLVTLLEVTFENTGEQSLKSSGYFIYTGAIAPVHERDLITYTGVDYFSKGKSIVKGVSWFTESRIPLLGIQTRSARPFLLEDAPDLTWAGVKNQYFTSILRPIEDLTGSRIWAKRFDIPATETRKTLPGIEAALGIGAFEIPAGGSVTHTYELYTGPKKYGWLKELGGSMDEILNYGIFKVVSIFLLKAMNILNGFLGSYALAIIVLTLIIKSALWPLQNKATASMRKMSALSPKMTELRAKYKDDPTRMNQELMKLYKDYGVNPFGGCLPMVVQIPIFFGFYSMLGSAVELRNSKFLWVNDLSQPDTVFSIGSIPINILPMVMAVSMLWQMKITPKTGDAVQQRIFLFMPLIFLLFCYNFASALALYWTVQNIFSIVQLYRTRNIPIPAMTKLTSPEADKKKKKKR